MPPSPPAEAPSAPSSFALSAFFLSSFFLLFFAASPSSSTCSSSSSRSFSPFLPSPPLSSLSLFLLFFFFLSLLLPRLLDLPLPSLGGVSSPLTPTAPPASIRSTASSNHPTASSSLTAASSALIAASSAHSAALRALRACRFQAQRCCSASSSSSSCCLRRDPLRDLECARDLGRRPDEERLRDELRFLGLSDSALPQEEDSDWEPLSSGEAEVDEGSRLPPLRRFLLADLDLWRRRGACAVTRCATQVQQCAWGELSAATNASEFVQCLH